MASGFHVRVFIVFRGCCENPAETENTRDENKKPEEFADKCEGLKEMALRTKNDNQELLGFTTYDGKFIIVDEGDFESVEMRVRKIGNSVYYDYPMGLGMPALSYFGMIVDNVNQRISIPIRGSVHTHPDGAGISIDNSNARSEDDLISAQMLWDISYFTNFVIEPSGNTYKTGYFDNDEYNKEYFNTRSGLTLEEICQ